MTRLILIILTGILCNIPGPSMAQLENSNWLFGNIAGLSFKTGSPVEINIPRFISSEGCAVISDYKGDLLLYSNGRDVWDASHRRMPNGFSLKGSIYSTQSAVIVPHPGNANQYFIFTVAPQGYSDGLCYSIADMTLNDGMGDITTMKNIPLITPVCEKIAVILHADKHTYWIIVHEFNSDRFYSYHLSSTGLDINPIISSSGYWIGNNSATANGGTAEGPMKASLDGKKVAVTTSRIHRSTQIFDFNAQTGILSNPIDIQHNYGTCQFTPYGVEFSPSGRFLYVSSILGCKQLLQYDLEASDPTNSAELIASSGCGVFGALQLGPDNRIYIANCYKGILSVIMQADSAGSGCLYKYGAVKMSEGICIQGLPTLIKQIRSLPRILTEYNCFSDFASFSAYLPSYDSLHWDFGDPASGILNTSQSPSPVHTFTKTPGSYTIMLIVWYYGIADTVYSDIKFLPEFTLGQDTTVCPNHRFLLTASYPEANFIWDNGSSSNTRLIIQPGIYWITLRTKGCIITDSIIIGTRDCPSEIRMPNVFTPNGDGYNDVFLPIEYTGILKPELQIFNRWGSLVFKTDDIVSGWNGTSKLGTINQGTYYWTLDYYDDTHKRSMVSGIVTLLL